MLKPVGDANAGEAQNRGRFGLGALVAWGASVRGWFLGGTRFVVSSLWTRLATVAIAMVATSAVAITLLPPMEYLPTGNRNLVFGIVLPPPGYNVSELIETGFQNQKVMMQHTGRELDGVPAVHRSFFVGDNARLIIGAVGQDPTRVRELRDFMQKLHAKIPGSIGFASQAALFSRGIGEGRAVEVELAGNDLAQLVGVAGKLFGELRALIPGAQVRPVPLLDLGAPELNVEPKRAQLAQVGFTPADLAVITDAYVDGRILGEYGKEGERKLDIVLKAAENAILDENSLEDAPVATPQGTIVPFGVLGEVKTRLGPTVIQRIERSRAVVLQVTPPDEMPFESAIQKVTEHVEKLETSGKLPASVKLSIGGSAGKLVTAQQQFLWILLAALVILYLLLAGLFENYVAPVVVLVTIPLAAAGGVLGLAATNAWLAPQPLDLMTALGFLILIGVVVNNAILIIDGAIQRVRSGTPLEEATVGAVQARVRPIFMSTLTSMAGLLPMVLATGSGAELYRGVGAVVLGGLAVSTVLALLVVPALFSLLWSGRAPEPGN
jgi:HAE1 family hydrophobic/amphiphilic exporter-1